MIVLGISSLNFLIPEKRRKEWRRGMVEKGHGYRRDWVKGWRRMEGLGNGERTGEERISG